MITLIIFTANYLPIVVAVFGAIILLFYWSKFKKNELPIYVIIALSLSLLIDKALNGIVDSPRPFVADDVTSLFPHVADNGFPSEHALFSMIIAGIVFRYNRPVGIILGVFALMIGIARVIAKVHNPLDILGSAGITLVTLFATAGLVRLIIQTNKDIKP